ncbi:MAG TPA: hypothetical protein VF771_12835 [Longimicrobiaceae bacterium]
MRTRIGSGLAIGVAAALALAACRGDARTPPSQQQQAQPAAGRLEVRLDVPQQPGWNVADTMVVTIANGSAAPVAGATLKVFVQAPVSVLADSAGALKPAVTSNQAGTWLRFPVGTIAAGQTVEIRQGIRTPPAPAPAAPPAPGQPRSRPAAKPDTSTRFLVRAELIRSTGDGDLLAQPAEDTIRVRAASAVVAGGCGNVGDVVVTRYGVGPVRVGMPVDALRTACPEARDTTWKSPGGAQDTGVVVMPGGRRAVAVTAGTTVERIVIDQPGLQTGAGAGVGATVGDLRGRFGRMCAGRAEKQVAVWFPNAPGISFGLDTAATKAWTPAQLAPDSVPDDVKIISLWVRKGSDDCPARPGEGGR